MKGFRTKKTREKYSKRVKQMKDEKGCPLCDREGLKLFKYWKIIENHFPYDRIAKIHHMLTPIRHVKEEDLNQNELMELRQIKNTFIKDSDYVYIIEATCNAKSIPSHFHLHLVVPK